MRVWIVEDRETGDGILGVYASLPALYDDIEHWDYTDLSITAWNVVGDEVDG